MNKAPHRHPRPLQAGSAAPAKTAPAIAPFQGAAPEPPLHPPVRHRARPVPISTGTDARGQVDVPAAPSANNTSPRDYPVGYKRPPAHTQYKPGQSGNRNGRPKGAKNFATLIEEELNTKITYRENGRVKTGTKKQVIAKKMVNKAAEGDPKSVQAIIKLDGPATAGAIGPASEAGELPDPAAQAERHRELIAEFLAMAREAPAGIPAPVEASEDDDA